MRNTELSSEDGPLPAFRRLGESPPPQRILVLPGRYRFFPGLMTLGHGTPVKCCKVASLDSVYARLLREYA